MPRGRRDSYSDDDSYDRTPPRRRNDRDDDRRDNRRGGHRDDRRDNRRDNRRDDERDDRRDNGRHRQRDVSPDDSRHRRDPKKSRRASPDDSLREIKPPKKQKIPTKVNRSCTDILFLLLFLIFFAAWIALATIVFSQVNMGELVADMVKDGKDQTCGSEGAPGKFLYIHNFKKAFKMNGLLPQIDFSDKERWCVKECPQKFINFTKPGELEGNVCFAEAAERIGKITADEEKWKQLQTEIEAKKCAQFVYPTHEILSFCIPDIGKLRKDSGNIENSDSTDSSAESNTVGPESYASNAIDSIKGAADSIAKMAEPETIVQIILDLWVSRFPIFAGFGVSLILALLWMLLMRWFAGIIVWVTTLLFPVVFGGLTGLSVYWTLDIWNDEFKPFDMKSITNVVYLASRYEFRLAVSVLVGIIFLLTVLIILFLRKRIAIAVALIKQASRSISHLPTLVIFPVMPYVLQAVGVAFGVTIYFLISTVRAKMEIEGSNLEEQCNEAVDGVAGGSLAGRKICGFVYSVLAKGWYIHVFNIFSSFWVVMFVGAFSYMVVAHAVARYFWTHKAEGSQCMAVGASVGTTARYHLGTIALGSLIVSIVSVIRIVLEWFQGKTKKDKNSCANFLARCCLCCFYMLEKFLKYINKNAYIMVAMYGKNFCRSAGKAFSLIMSNALRALVVTKLTDFVIFIAKVVTSACAATILYFVYQSDSLRESLSLPELFSVFVPVIATGIGSFVVTSCFFNVYRSAVDTLFLCFLEDKKINDGSRERPYRMPTELKRIFDRKNHK